MQAMPPDDTDSLRRSLPGGHFDYRDISSEHARQRALERWPLLAEVAALGTGYIDTDRGIRPAPSLQHSG